jgi:hypothetical protein
LTDINDDPFANVEETGASADAQPEDKVPADGFDFEAFLAEMTIDDEDFEAPTPIVDRYIRPAEGSWIPVRIVSVDTTQHDMKAVVATLPDGSFVTVPNQINLAVEKGMTQSVENVTLWQYVVEADHVANCYGERSNAYRLYTPVFPMRVPLNKPRNRGGVEEIGFDKSSGKKLLAATRVVKPGEKVTEDNEELLRSLGDAMTADGGKIVMARVRYRVKKSEESVPRKKADGTFLKGAIDQTSGSFIKLRKSGNEYVYVEGGATYEGDTSGLIPFGDTFLIPDDSDDGVRVQDIVKREATYDNLADDVAVVPGRQVEINRPDGSSVTAEVTWETVGAITVQPVRAGTLIQAVTEDKEIITASWLGTHWEDVGPHELTVPSEGPDMGKVVLSPVTQGSKDGSAAAPGLDVFKGDAAS